MQACVPMTVDQYGSSAPDHLITPPKSDRTPHSHAAHSPWAIPVLLGLAFFLGIFASVGNAQKSTATLTVGTPTVDANGVKYYPVSSVYQGSQPQYIRVLQPTNPASGQFPKILFVLPIDAGVDTTSAAFGDGLEELRLLGVPDLFNITLIAPSFNYEPWYGDHPGDATRRMESFIIDDLVPFADAFAQGSVPQRYLIGFSKSGNGVLFLLLKHPGIFNAAGAWAAPVQVSNINQTGLGPGLPINFGNQTNFDLYNIPSLVSSNAGPFLQQNRFWISGDQSWFTTDMEELNTQMTAAGMLHTWVAGGNQAHRWGSGWLNGAITSLDQNATLTAPFPGQLPPPRTGGLPFGVLHSGTTKATLTLNTDEPATCRYATSAGTAYDGMSNTFSTTGETLHSTEVSEMQDGGSYEYYVRCKDSATGAVNNDDYVIRFSVAVPAGAPGATATSSFSGVEAPLSENGVWDTPGSWDSLQKNDGAYSTSKSSAARLVTPVTDPDQFAEIVYDQDPGPDSWVGVITRVQGSGNGSGYLALASNSQVVLFRSDDSAMLNFTLLASASASLGAAPRQLRLESFGSTHRVYFNGALEFTYTDPSNLYAIGQPGIAASVYGGPTVKILSFNGGALPPLAAAPTFSVPGGTYTDTQSVTIRDATAGATIYYTTDGKMPTTDSALYSGPIQVSKTETLSAIAVASGHSASLVTSANYTIPPTFTLGASPAALTVTSGGQGTVTLSVTPQHGFDSTVSFSCSGLPGGTGCSFSPSTVTLSGNAATSTLTISASAQSANLRTDGGSMFSKIVLAGMLLLFGWRRRRGLLFLVLLAALGTGMLSGCGGGGGSGSKAPVNATVTVTAVSGAIQKVTNLSLVVN